MSETILVTGGLGYIGSHIVILLLEKNFKVVVVDNLSNADVTTLHKIYTITNKTITFLAYDINDQEKMKEIFENHAITKVIHLAALKSVPLSVAQPLEYYHTNVTGTLNLLRLMKQYNVKTFIFSSTAAVYQSSNYLLSESAPTNPITPYGRSKLMIEQLLYDLHISDPTFNIVILRYFNPVGNHASGLLIDLKGGNIMPEICKSLINNTMLTIYTYQLPNNIENKDIVGIRDYIHVMDLADAHLHVLSLTGHHLYNVGTGQGTTTLDLVNCMSTTLNKQIHYELGPPRQGDQYMAVCSAHKINTLLNWQPQYTLTHMCEDVKTALIQHHYLT